MWSRVSSYSLQFLQVAVLVSPILCRCLFNLQCPVIAQIMSLRSVLYLFNRNLVFFLLGPSIMVLLCLQSTKLFHRFACLLSKNCLTMVLCVNPNVRLGPWNIPLLPPRARRSAISFPSTLLCPGTHMRVQLPFKVFREAWLSEHILMFSLCVSFEVKILQVLFMAYVSACLIEAYMSNDWEMLSWGFTEWIPMPDPDLFRVHLCRFLCLPV